MLKKLAGLGAIVILIGAYVLFLQRYGIDLIEEDSVDFPSYYYGAKLAFVEKESPYLEENLQEAFKEYSENNGDYFPYLYAPPSLILFAPFTLLPYRDARFAMLVVNHVLLLIFVGVLLFKILRSSLTSPFAVLFVAYLFSFAPLHLTLDIGQVNIIVLLLTCLAWWLAREERHPFWAALSLGLAIVMKLYPVLFLIPLVLNKRYKTAIYTLAVVLVFSAFATLFLPSDTWGTWYANVGSKGYTEEVLNLSTNAPANQSMFGFFLRTFFGKNVRFAPLLVVPDWVSSLAPYVAAGVVGVVSFGLSYWTRPLNLPVPLSKLDLDLSLWTFVIFLIAPVSWDHHLLFLVPAMAVMTYTFWWLEIRTHFVYQMVSILIAIALAVPFPYNSPAFRTGANTLLISASLYLVGLLWLLLAVFLITETRVKKSVSRTFTPRVP